MAEGTAQFTQTKVNTGRVLRHHQVLDDGQGISWVESRELDLGSVRDLKYLDVVHLIFDQVPQGLKIRIQYRDTLQEDVQIADLDYYDGKIYPDISARYFAIKFFDVNPVVKWKLTQIDFFGIMDGGMFL